MKGVNKVVLLGNLGKDPDLQYLESNLPVVRFSLATSESFKDKTGQVNSQTEWHSVVLWRGLAELAYKNLKKGSLIYLEGKLKTRSYVDKEHHRKTITEIVGYDFILLDRRNGQQQSEGVSDGGTEPYLQ